MAGIVNRTGAGFHRDSRREARMSRGQLKRALVQEDLNDLVIPEDEPGFWYDPSKAEQEELDREEGPR